MSKGFTRVARLGDLRPGTMRCYELGNACILLANVGGQVYAVDDLCTHEDASLATGALQGEYVKCPLHGSRFDLRSGEPLEEPAEEPLRTYAVKIEGDDILVELSRTEEPS